jgi:hypothetical protein
MKKVFAVVCGSQRRGRRPCRVRVQPLSKTRVCGLLSEDRLRFDGLDTGVYRYAKASPVLFTDPFGFASHGPTLPPAMCAIILLPKFLKDPVDGCKGNCEDPRRPGLPR